MTDRNTLYQLLFDALLEIRADGHASANAKEWKLADLFHNLPLSLQALDEGTVTAEQVLQQLRERSKPLGIEQWIDNRLEGSPKEVKEVMS